MSYALEPSQGEDAKQKHPILRKENAAAYLWLKCGRILERERDTPNQRQTPKKFTVDASMDAAWETGRNDRDANGHGQRSDLIVDAIRIRCFI